MLAMAHYNKFENGQMFLHNNDTSFWIHTKFIGKRVLWWQMLDCTESIGQRSFLSAGPNFKDHTLSSRKCLWLRESKGL